MKPVDTIQTALEAYVQECPSEAKSIDKAWGKVTLALSCVTALRNVKGNITIENGIATLPDGTQIKL